MPETPTNREIEEKAHWIPYPMKRFFSLQEASIYTAMGELSIKQAYYKGLLPAIQRGARSKLIFDVKDLDSWMLAGKKQHEAVSSKMRARNGRFIK
jgi:hypothetical protein